jgi:hypothetical protein
MLPKLKVEFEPSVALVDKVAHSGFRRAGGSERDLASQHGSQALAVPVVRQVHADQDGRVDLANQAPCQDLTKASIPWPLLVNGD